MRYRLLLIFLLLVTSLESCSASVKKYSIQVVAEYNHDRSAYTQGLFFYDSKFYESTGVNGQSSFREVDLKTGKVLKKMDFSPRYFVEGSSILGDNLYVLTWESYLVFVYDAKTLQYKKAYNYPRQGWGLTTDGKQLIASDGSDKIYFMDSNLSVKKQIKVTKDGSPVRYLNELEWIDGKIWANVYTTDYILIINPNTGVVEGEIDCRNLLPKKLRDENTDVLNGIAYNPKDGKIYITGKNWPRLYEIKLVVKPN